MLTAACVVIALVATVAAVMGVSNEDIDRVLGIGPAGHVAVSLLLTMIVIRPGWAIGEAISGTLRMWRQNRR